MPQRGSFESPADAGLSNSSNRAFAQLTPRLPHSAKPHARVLPQRGSNMRMEKEMVRLYAVTDRKWLGTKSLAEAVEEALRGGATMVQLREKNISEEELIREAIELLPICRRWAAPLIIDNDVNACMKSGADGVHLGQSDMPVREARAFLGPDRIIGATAHSPEEAVRAEQDGADYLGSGAAFVTRSKSDAVPIRFDTYRAITSSVRIPVCAIGGINAGNIEELAGYGLSGVAVIEGIFAQDNIEEACRRLLEKSRKL